MRCKKYLKKNFLQCLVSEIELFVYIFGRISKWPPEVRKGSLVKFFEVSYYQKNFQPPTVHMSTTISQSFVKIRSKSKRGCRFKNSPEGNRRDSNLC